MTLLLFSSVAAEEADSSKVELPSLEEVTKLVTGRGVTLVGADSNTNSTYDGVVAIVDPPRTGLHRDVTK